MNFEVQPYLKRATSRAKSDVANKLVSMLLHEISKAVCTKVGLSVTDPAYGRAVAECFGNSCPYCRRELLANRVAVEHLEGMNRFRVGLHIPGNVLVSCGECNKEKRRDDQQKSLLLADTGWAQFLCHDGSRCPATCRTCSYWRKLFPADGLRMNLLQEARTRIKTFVGRPEFAALMDFAAACRTQIRSEVEKLYREGQDFAHARIEETKDRMLSSLSEFRTDQI